MIYAAILAGGTGKRFGDRNLPKQFQILGTKPLILHTIEQFLLCPKFAKILILPPKDWLSFMVDLLKKYQIKSDKIILIEGGETRNDTIMNACRFIEKNWGITARDSIVTHDAVRPFINQRIIHDNITALKKFDAVDTAIPATDTIISVGADNMISSVPNRSEIWLGQTPQSFRIEKLMKLFKSLTRREKAILTDACKIFVLKGEPVKIVLGAPQNLKITTVFDLSIANAILEIRDKSESAKTATKKNDGSKST